MTERDLYPIYGMHRVPFWQQWWFIFVCAVIIFCLVIWCGVVIVQKYCARKKVSSPSEQALAQLQDMLDNPDGYRFDEVYALLSRIAKEFFAQCYAYPVLGMTDQEFIAYIKKTGIAASHVQVLEDVTVERALVKYAHDSTGVRDHIRLDIERICALIIHMTPKKKK